MIYRNWKFFVYGLITVVLIGLVGSLALKATGMPGMSESTQMYSASRYAILNAPVLVMEQTGGNQFVQNALFKVDTATGQVWVLQMTILASNNPVIMSANFVPVNMQNSYSQTPMTNENPLTDN